MENSTIYHRLDLEAGVHSAASFLMFPGGGIDERIDRDALVDTQDEPESVYRHLDRLGPPGGPPILADAAGPLGDDLIPGRNSTGQRFASIPAFTSSTGRLIDGPGEARGIERALGQLPIGLGVLRFLRAKEP